jgi:hypothetical protein
MWCIGRSVSNSGSAGGRAEEGSVMIADAGRGQILIEELLSLWCAGIS